MHILALFGRIVILLYCVGLGVGVLYIAWKSSDPNGLATVLSPTAQTSMIFVLELSGAFLVFVVGVYLGYLGVFWDRLEKKINISLKTSSLPAASSGPNVSVGPGMSQMMITALGGMRSTAMPSAALASLSLTSQPLTLQSFTSREDPRIQELMEHRRPMEEVMRMRRTIALERMKLRSLQRRR